MLRIDSRFGQLRPRPHSHKFISLYTSKHLKTTRLCLIFSSFLFTKPSLISSVWRVEYCFLVLALLKVSAPCVGRQTYRRHSPPNLPVFESHTACTTNLRTSDDSESLPSPPETRRFWSPPGSSAVTRPSSFLSEFKAMSCAETCGSMTRQKHQSSGRSRRRGSDEMVSGETRRPLCWY